MYSLVHFWGSNPNAAGWAGVCLVLIITQVARRG